MPARYAPPTTRRRLASCTETACSTGGETCARELCMEADGTYFRAQGLPDGAPKRFEVKAVCAYAEKEAESGKVRRRGTVHHALVGRAGELWSEGVATVGKKYDLAKIERVHLGRTERGGAGTPDASCRMRKSRSTWTPSI